MPFKQENCRIMIYVINIIFQWKEVIIEHLICFFEQFFFFIK